MITAACEGCCEGWEQLQRQVVAAGDRVRATRKGRGSLFNVVHGIGLKMKARLIVIIIITLTPTVTPSSTSHP